MWKSTSVKIQFFVCLPVYCFEDVYTVLSYVQRQLIQLQRSLPQPVPRAFDVFVLSYVQRHLIQLQRSLPRPVPRAFDVFVELSGLRRSPLKTETFIMLASGESIAYCAEWSGFICFLERSAWCLSSGSTTLPVNFNTLRQSVFISLACFFFPRLQVACEENWFNGQFTVASHFRFVTMITAHWASDKRYCGLLEIRKWKSIAAVSVVCGGLWYLKWEWRERLRCSD